MKFIKTPLITSSEQFATLNLQRGQWVQLEWCDKPSRFHHIRKDDQGRVANVTAFHWPFANSGFNRYCACSRQLAVLLAQVDYARSFNS